MAARPAEAGCGMIAGFGLALAQKLTDTESDIAEAGARYGNYLPPCPA
jgi:hypothetical protein